MKLQISVLLVFTFASSCNAIYLKWVNVSRPPVPSDYTGYVRPWYFARLGDVTATETVESDLESVSYQTPLITVGTEFDDVIPPYTTDATFYDGSKTVEAFNAPLPFSTPLITEPQDVSPATLAVDIKSDILVPLAEKVADSIEPLTDMLDGFVQPFKQVAESFNTENDEEDEKDEVNLRKPDPLSGSSLESNLDVNIENPLAFLKTISKRESMNQVSETDFEEDLAKRGESGQESESVYIDLSQDDFERVFLSIGSLKEKREDGEIHEETKTVTPSIERLPFVTSLAGEEIVEEAKNDSDVEKQVEIEKRFRDLFGFGASLVPQGGFAVDTKGNTQFGLNYQGNPIGDATKAIMDGIPPLPSLPPLKPLNASKPLNVSKLFDWLAPKEKRGDDQYKTTSFETTRDGDKDRVPEDGHHQDEILTCGCQPQKRHTQNADLLVTNENIPRPAEAEDAEKYLPD